MIEFLKSSIFNLQSSILNIFRSSIFNLQSSIFKHQCSKLFEFFYKHTNFLGKRGSFRSGYPLQPQAALIDPKQPE